MDERWELLADLALGLLNNTLSAEEKELTQNLIIHDEMFLEILKTEITMKKALESLKKTIPPATSKQVYLDITTSKEELVFKKVVNLVLENILPEMLQPLSKLVQRSVLVNE